MAIEVRPATPADADEIATVCASAVATLRQTYRPNEKALALKQQHAAALMRLVALDGGRVVGKVDYRLTPERVHFLSLDVHEEFRRRGVARRLVEELARIGREAGADRLSTYTVTQTGNPAIFTRLGFQVVFEEPTDLFESDRFDSLTETYLELPLS